MFSGLSSNIYHSQIMMSKHLSIIHLAIGRWHWYFILKCILFLNTSAITQSASSYYFSVKSWCWISSVPWIAVFVESVKSNKVYMFDRTHRWWKTKLFEWSQGRWKFEFLLTENLCYRNEQGNVKSIKSQQIKWKLCLDNPSFPLKDKSNSF